MATARPALPANSTMAPLAEPASYLEVSAPTTSRGRFRIARVEPLTK
jgi:hypothetical protein